LSRPLRILQLIESASGGSGLNATDLSQALAKQGHDVHLVFSPKRSDEGFLEQVRLLQAAGGTATEFPMEREVGRDDARAVRAFRRLLRAEGPFDVVHLQSSKAGAIGRLAKPGFRHVTVYTPHLFRTASPGLGRAAKLIYGAIERFLDRFSDATICVSEYERKHALSIGLPARKLHTIYNGLVPPPIGDRQARRAELGYAPTDVVVGFVGRLMPQKAPAHLVEAFKRLKDAPAAKLLMLGDGPLRAEAEAAAQPIKDRVTWLGPAKGTDWMAAMDILAMPSVAEGFSYVLLEAAANNLAILATDVGGNGEFVKSGETGLLVPSGDVEAYAAALQSLVDSPDLRERLSGAAKASLRDFTPEVMVEKTLALYRSLLEKRG
jgi:glycosyltransferase involved in cell wall biosynthesis